jgi:hypothetical protein
MPDHLQPLVYLLVALSTVRGRIRRLQSESSLPGRRCRPRLELVVARHVTTLAGGVSIS